MFRHISLALGLVLMSSGCATVEQRQVRFASMSCDQLAVALNHETDAERDARRTGVATGIASIFESGSDEALLSIDSDIAFIEADDHRTSVKAIRAEQQRRCN